MKKATVKNSLLEDFKNFEEKFKQEKENEIELEKLRKIFVQTFSKEKIPALSLDDYVVGKQNDKSFCNYLETCLKELGDMHCSTAIRFGVYYGKYGNDNKKNYRYAKKFGKSVEESFYNVKQEILKLLEDGKNKNFQGIKNNKISTIYKGKILVTYFPEKYLNIFSDEHLDYFLVNLNMSDALIFETLEKQEKLLDFKNNNSTTIKWSNYMFSYFLYDKFGKPPKNQNLQEFIEDERIKKEINEEFPSDYLQSDTIYKGAKDKPTPVINEGGIVYPRNKKYSIQALANANFSCEIESTHPSFIRKNGINYTETHHLIPMRFQKNFQNSLDIPENIISLCSNCHNQIHYGKDANKLIKQLYEQRKDFLKNAQLEISLKNLLNMYK